MQITAKGGANLTNDSDILRKCNSFYSDLYTTKSTKITEDLEKKFLALNTHTNLMKLIRKNARASYRRENSCHEALKSIESGKSPGTLTVSLLNFIKFSGKMYLPFL